MADITLTAQKLWPVTVVANYDLGERLIAERRPVPVPMR
jgi:hypothetical protein